MPICTKLLKTNSRVRSRLRICLKTAAPEDIPQHSSSPDMPPAAPDSEALFREADAAAGRASSASLSAGSKEPQLPMDRPVLLRTLLSNPVWANHRFAALTILKTIAQAFPVLDGIRKRKGKPASLPMEDLKDFLFDIAPHLSMLGITLMLPQAMRNLLRPKLVGAAAATFGLISAVLIGGPVGRRLIVKYDLKPEENNENYDDIESVNAASGAKLTGLDVIKNVVVILVCMAVGTVISGKIGQLIDMSFPTYVGAMFVAVIVRNLNDRFHLYNFSFSLVDGIGDVMLNLYLGLALMTLKLWELAGLVGGVLLVVVCQVIFMILVANFVVFRVLGRNYDAAVMCAGLCGHGLGATPSAIVNMTAVTEKYGMSRRAFMVVPIVGAFLVDIIYQPQTIAFIKFFVHGFTG